MLSGYRGLARTLLEKAGAKIGDYIEIISGGKSYRGILMPRYELADESHISIKLDNGYNIGVRINGDTVIKLIGKRVERRPPREKMKSRGRVKLSFIGTGGTILSRIDYETGAVKPSFTLEDLIDMVPEAETEYYVEMLELMMVFSEDLTPEHWGKMALKIGEKVESGFDGVVIAHGTDTMGYTAAALSFALQGLPVPVILVGSQRSSDRPSSDAALNLRSAFRYAGYGEYAGVFVAMHGSMSDDEIHIHRGTRVRKLHTSRRDAFRSVNARIVAKVLKSGEIRYVDTSGLRRRGEGKLKVRANFESKVALVKMYPGLQEDILEHLIDADYKGIVLEGTGLGHIARRLVPLIKKATSKGIVVVMTSQCLWGRINMNVYSTGRELQQAGVIGLEDMLPETALVKLMWTLGQTDEPEEVKRIMLTNIAGEIGLRSLPEYGVTQGD